MHNTAASSGKLALERVAVSVILIVAVAAGATAGVTLPVEFLAQGPGNNNCGPATLVMAGCYVKGQEPTAAMVVEVNGSLSVTDQDDKSAEQLITAGQKVFGLALQKHHWDLLDVKNQVEAGGPVIVAVKASLLPNRGYPYQGDHFVLVIGFGGEQIICNDPGAKEGERKQYAASDFDQAMKSEGGVVVAGFEKAPPQPKITKAYISPVSCDCKEAGKHGNVVLVFADGSQKQETYPADGFSSQPRLAADSQTVGWLYGSHAKVWDDTHYIADRVYFDYQFPDPPRRRIIVSYTLNAMIFDWQFREGGAKAALAVGAAKRGITDYILIDVKNGQVLDQCRSDYYVAVRGAKRPGWVTGLPKYE